MTSSPASGRLRVVLASDAYPPIIGGATRAAQQLGRQLTARGHEVAVVTAWQRGIPAREDDGGVEVHRLPGLVSRATWLSSDPHRYTPPPFPDPELVWRLRGLMRRLRPDIVHSYGWLTYSVAVALRGLGVPLLLAAREYAYVCPVRTLVRQGERRGEICDGPALRKCLECAGSFYGRPKGVVAVTGVLAGRALLRSAQNGLHSTSRYTQASMHAHLTGHPIEPDRVVPDFREDDLTGPPDAAILGFLPSEPYILFVGAFRRIKGDEILLAAYRQLSDPPPLVMIGARSPEPLPEFPPGVVPIFDVPHDTVMAAWDRALFGVSPSVVPEALGNVVHEAMSRGKAVIGTYPGGHTDMICQGENGLLVPGGDVEALVGALRRLIGDREERAHMGEAARRTAGRFTAGAVVPAMEALYEATIASFSRSRGRPLWAEGPS